MDTIAIEVLTLLTTTLMKFHAENVELVLFWGIVNLNSHTLQVSLSLSFSLSFPFTQMDLNIMSNKSQLYPGDLFPFTFIAKKGAFRPKLDRTERKIHGKIGKNFQKPFSPEVYC